MSIVFNYINSWLYTPELNLDATPVIKTSDKTTIYLVSATELLSVKLKPVTDVIPSPARNMPNINKFQLHMLNKAQLSAILSVKLKSVKRPLKPMVYLPRHPVLRELLSTRTLVC